MKITGIVSILIGIFLVLAVMLAIQGLMGGDWETTAQDVATISVMVVVFIMIVGSIFYYLRK